MNALAHRPISLAVLVVASALLADSAGLDGDPSLKAAGAQEREGKIKANGITIAWEYQRAKHRTIKVPTVVVHGTEVRLGTSWKMGLGIDVEARLTDEEDLWLDLGIHDRSGLNRSSCPFPQNRWYLAAPSVDGRLDRSLCGRLRNPTPGRITHDKDGLHHRGVQRHRPLNCPIVSGAGLECGGDHAQPRPGGRLDQAGSNSGITPRCHGRREHPGCNGPGCHLFRCGRCPCEQCRL